MIELFDASSRNYDWVNALMSLGTGRRYRHSALRRAGLANGMHVLDVGCGTGDLALAAQELVGNRGRSVGLDPTRGMLARARSRGLQQACLGQGENLPFRTETFDVVTMGYALRHLDCLLRSFREFFRVLRPGGRLLILEVSRPEGRLEQLMLKGYLKYLVPNLARMRQGGRSTKELMRYYWETIELCVDPSSILDALEDVGLEEPRRLVRGRVLSEYVARKPCLV